MIPYVAVIGASEASDNQLLLARRVGQLLAEHGAVMVCGGLGGVMEAACEGVAAAGGTAIGLLPGLRRSDANPHVSIALATGLGELRNGLIVRAADAVIAIGGGWGTLSEVALALRVGTPLFLLDSWAAVRGASSVEEQIGIQVNEPEEAVRRSLEAVPGLT